MRPRKPHAPAQAAVLGFIKSEIAAGRGFPSERSISDHMGWIHTVSARDVLMALGANRHLRPVSRVPAGRGCRYTWEVAA